MQKSERREQREHVFHKLVLKRRRGYRTVNSHANNVIKGATTVCAGRTKRAGPLSRVCGRR